MMTMVQVAIQSQTQFLHCRIRNLNPSRYQLGVVACQLVCHRWRFAYRRWWRNGGAQTAHMGYRDDTSLAPFESILSS